MRSLSYNELRSLYRNFLKTQKIIDSTINTAYSDTFYLWRNENKELFWNTVTDTDFENVARITILKTLSEHSSGNIKALVNPYLSHLRRFRLFLTTDIDDKTPVLNKQKSTTRKQTHKKKLDGSVPCPSIEQVEFYLKKWESLMNYRLQEDALNKLFFVLCPMNTDLVDILIKASTLNDFYSTNIFSIYPVAVHIYNLNIDARLKTGDIHLVEDIQKVTIGDKTKNFYSFASKYCSHHNPLEYPIYDGYVNDVLCYFRECDCFSDFKNKDLKNYVNFREILISFRSFYGLDKYNLKQIDQYLWQLGKDCFLKKYGKKK